MVKFEKAERYNPAKHAGFFVVEEKLDGLRLLLKKGKAFFREQDGVSVNAWDKLPEHIQSLAIDEFIDGELYIPGATASEALKLANRHNLQFRGFYLPERTHLFPIDHHELIMAYGLNTPAIISREKTPSLEYLENLLNNFDGSKEGFILKREIAFPLWFKYKVEETADLVILGYSPGTGKYKGKIGAILCGGIVNGEVKEVAKVSGMVEEIRFGLTDQDIGRIVEVKFQEVASRGRLRHPRFIRFRDDKTRPDKIT